MKLPSFITVILTRITGFLDYLVSGLGFESIQDFKISGFGYMLNFKIFSISITFGVVQTFIKSQFGIPLTVFTAFVLLNALEFYTGIKAARQKGQKIESRKMGRMFFKISVYIFTIYTLEQFKTDLDLPFISQINFNPFEVLYWGFLAGVIWQLYKSLMENFKALGWKEAGGMFSFITKGAKNYFKNEKDNS